MDERPVLDSEIDYRNPSFNTGHDRVRWPDGEAAYYYC
jgi:hypothetical protein